MTLSKQLRAVAMLLLLLSAQLITSSVVATEERWNLRTAAASVDAATSNERSTNSQQTTTATTTAAAAANETIADDDTKSQQTLSFLLLGDWGKGGLSGQLSGARSEEDGGHEQQQKQKQQNQKNQKTLQLQLQQPQQQQEQQQQHVREGDLLQEETTEEEGEHRDEDKFYQNEVAIAMGNYSAYLAATPPSFVLALGDNFYDDGVFSTNDSSWYHLWKAVYFDNHRFNDSLAVPWYPVLGNHDYGGGEQAVQAQLDRYSQHTDDDLWMMQARNYSRRFGIPGGGIVQVIFVDTTTLAPSVNRCCNEEGGVSTDEQAARISSQLQHLERLFSEATGIPSNKTTAATTTTATTATTTTTAAATGTTTAGPPHWLLVVGHYPIFSVGEEGDVSELKQYLLPLLEKYNVHAYICGHDHMAEHLQSANSSVQFFVVGAGTMTDYVQSESEATTVWVGPEYASYANMEATQEELSITYRDINNNVKYQYTMNNPSAAVVKRGGDEERNKNSTDDKGAASSATSSKNQQQQQSQLTSLWSNIKSSKVALATGSSFALLLIILVACFVTARSTADNSNNNSSGGGFNKKKLPLQLLELARSRRHRGNAILPTSEHDAAALDDAATAATTPQQKQQQQQQKQQFAVTLLDPKEDDATTTASAAGKKRNSKNNKNSRTDRSDSAALHNYSSLTTAATSSTLNNNSSSSSSRGLAGHVSVRDLEAGSRQRPSSEDINSRNKSYRNRRSTSFAAVSASDDDDNNNSSYAQKRKQGHRKSRSMAV